MSFQKVAQIGILLTLAIGLSEQTLKEENFVYKTDWFLYPAQDGSKGVVPALLTDTEPTQAKAADPADIHFYLYTQSHQVTPYELFVGDEENLSKSGFVKNAALKILCHGYDSKYTNPFPAGTRKKYLDTRGNINVIVINWELLAAAPWYWWATGNVPLVGQLTASLINFLVSEGYITPDKIHCAGHSLGAHAMGIASRGVVDLARVTGLDPASPSWADRPDRISPDVADFVDIIHTSVDFLGIRAPLGHVDFYPNGGEDQPGCPIWNFGCSHSRSHEYFSESIVPLGQGERFGSCLCSNCQVRADCYKDRFLLGKCSCAPKIHMGEDAYGARGTFYLNTNERSPFSLDRRHAPTTVTSNGSGLIGNLELKRGGLPDTVASNITKVL